ncbi:hypothetical protein LTR27_009510 [Elasticomyces elasticus]|nr:hypothetical protein LTR27_009510 [Elasticomyces elasticus]
MTARDFTPSSSSSSTEPGSPGVMNNNSLHALQSDEARDLMNVVDNLRHVGLSSELQLPMLVVSGDQSSGKSSVLEAITEIPFPRKENMCTRFATEITLRRHPITSISVKIIPDIQRPAADKKISERFNRTIEDFTELPDLIEEATDMMGLRSTDGGPVPAFSRDVLSIEIAGPDRQPLTLVDLPGLIQTATEEASDQDKAVVRALINDYIKDQRTIIIAVLSARGDLANQEILSLSKGVDPQRKRTLGVITKPDNLEVGSDMEAYWLKLAKNEKTVLQLGWHTLRNRSAMQATMSFHQRNAAEAAFFETGKFSELPQGVVGIKALRTRLGNILFEHLRTIVPRLRPELDHKLDELEDELARLGKKPEGSREQRAVLTNVSDSYRTIVRSAVDGPYKQYKFFGNLDSDGSANYDRRARRLRAVVHELNENFAYTMEHFGRKTVIGPETGSKRSAEQEVDAEYAELAKRQKVVTLDSALHSARRTIDWSRGLELPGVFNSAHISELFQDQSHYWPEIARFHVKIVARACESLVKTAVEHTALPHVAVRLLNNTIDHILSSRLKRARDELQQIVVDSQLHPITYNPKHVDTVKENRRKRQEIKRTNHVFDLTNEGRRRNVGAAEHALDHEQAYYGDEVTIFIANVTRQVVERHLMQDLADETVPPVFVGDLTDDEVAALLDEPEHIAQRHSRLEARRTALEEGQKILRAYGRV